MKILIQVGDVRRVVEVLFPQRGLAGSLQEVSGVGFGGGRLLRKILLIGAQHRILKLLAGLRRDGVGNVPEAAVLVLAAGHGDKQPLRPLDDLDVMDGKVVVDGDRDQRAQAVFGVGFSDADIGNVHGNSPLCRVKWNVVVKGSMGAAAGRYTQRGGIYWGW